MRNLGCALAMLSTIGCAYGGSAGAGALAKTGSPVIAPQAHGEAWMGFGDSKGVYQALSARLSGGYDVVEGKPAIGAIFGLGYLRPPDKLGWRLGPAGGVQTAGERVGAVFGVQLGVFQQTSWKYEKEPMRSGGWNYVTSIGVDGLIGYSVPVGKVELPPGLFVTAALTIRYDVIQDWQLTFH